MTFLNKTQIFAVLFIALIASCSKDFSDVGRSVLPDDMYLSSRTTYPLTLTHHSIDVFRTDNLPLYQLGTYQDPIFGSTEAVFNTQLTLSSLNPSFGSVSQSSEDEREHTDESLKQEQETVTAVWLEIPFFNNQNDADGDGVIDTFDVDSTTIESDSDGDGLTDIYESRNGLNPLEQDTDGDGILDADDEDTTHPDLGTNQYDIDSLFGNHDQTFHLKIEKLSYFLRELDLDDNFEKTQAYYSDREFMQNFTDGVFFDDQITINKNELTFNYKEDDPDTEDVDETELIETRLSPRIRVPLTPSFFQENILDLEGEEEFSSLNSFKTHLRGLVISTSNLQSPLLLLLNFDAAQINIEYTYKKLDNNDTSDDLTDDTVEDTDGVFTIPFAPRVRSNTIIRTTGFSSPVVEALTNTQPVTRAYLKGGLGVFNEIELFKDAEGNDYLESFRENTWLINEANLIFYVDRLAMDAADLQEPYRLYLYNAETGEPLTDHLIDVTNSSKRSGNKIIHSGYAVKNDNDEITSYKIRITEHLSNILREETAENTKLRLVVSSDINNTATTSVILPDEIIIPSSSLVNPFGTILHGPESENEAMRVMLEIFYTDIN